MLAVCARAEALPFRDGAFDAAVESLAFCSIEEPESALAEIQRVVRPGGELRMLDHVRAPGPLLGHLQDLLAPAWLRVSGGCHLNRRVSAYLEAAGLRAERRLRRLRGTFEELVVRL